MGAWLFRLAVVGAFVLAVLLVRTGVWHFHSRPWASRLMIASATVLMLVVLIGLAG
jgi:hypothetical protein